VTALIATSIGSDVTAICSNSTTTEVPSRPRGERFSSGTGVSRLRGDLFEICPELGEVHPRCAPEQRAHRVRTDESISPQCCGLSNRGPVPGHNKCLTPVQATHYLPTLVAEFSLSYLSWWSCLSRHLASGARRATALGSTTCSNASGPPRAAQYRYESGL
jgi:hypothetical protein